MAMQHYSGGCQCGAVRFEVDVDLDHTVTCNCSRCRPLGSILAFAPASAFHLVKGEGATTEYLFNSGKIHHLFCSTCGIESFARGTAPDGADVVAVNARCLEGVDLKALHPVEYDGASK
ncbi:GFA family protein [Xanthobacter autotrophicus]|uniref:GFA family protein n=1 Tax=Xanthobacter TaxID=279 RepID=UPI0024AAB213|nr:GFA family protein [Xanthobacter autotrophicus]MDI4666849.1 GFA family protein [Xanthobacter autotrophicus]